jgi:NAD(P)-dependent dehydrogenase (short-subunit alcohol dehydrogenase family)
MRGAVDSLLEVPVAPSFTRIGYEVRRRLSPWETFEAGQLAGQVMVVTGGTSGLGRAAATKLAAAGATVAIVGRNEARNSQAVKAIASATGSDQVDHLTADMGELAQVRSLAAELSDRYPKIDVLIHNAGALLEQRQVTNDGIEATVASQVVGPFLLTSLLIGRLTVSPPTRVLTMSSGGMYASPLRVHDLQMSESSYRGAEQYARAKRAQVTLNEVWADRHGHRDIFFHALHPGWADTPGVDESLPLFARVMGPLLRSPEQGADTLVWLASSDRALADNGGFWHDRRLRPIHRLPLTRRSDTVARRVELWDWACRTAGVRPCC